jgi:hypothetical protein
MLTLPRGTKPHMLRVRKKSYQEHTTEFVPDRDNRFELTLTPSWAVPFSPKPKPPR